MDGPTGVDTTWVGVGVVFTLEVEDCVLVLAELAEVTVVEDEDEPVEVVELPVCAELEEVTELEGWG